MHRRLTFNNIREENDFVACTVEGCSYLATAKDRTIMGKMFIHRVNWAAGSMKRFQELAKQYYNIDDSAGYFLDLGANIGTTGIYFIKNLAPNLKLLSFEPDPENYKMHRINLILNDLDSVATLVNCGLGDKFDEMTLYKKVLSDPGRNSVLYTGEDSKIGETIKIIPLDSYLAENKIAASEVKYIWIDTEGFEIQVLLGAKNLLAKNPVPVFMECNLKAWDNSGCFEYVMSLLEEYYSHFILFADKHFIVSVGGGKEQLFPIEDLRTIKRVERINNGLGKVGDIFLIRRGAID